MELLIRTKWDNDVETIMHLKILDSVHHDNSGLLCMTEGGQKVDTLQAITTLKPDFARTTSVSFGIHNGLRSIEIILKFVHLRAKNKKVLGLHSLPVAGFTGEPQGSPTHLRCEID